MACHQLYFTLSSSSLLFFCCLSLLFSNYSTASASSTPSPFSSLPFFGILKTKNQQKATETTTTMSTTTTTQISTPTLVVNKSKCLENIRRMKAKTSSNNKIKIRPHCKTHASIEIANWILKELGDDCCNGITVSSLSMAEYFSSSPSIRDITVAFPLNILEIDKVERLLQIKDMKLNLLVENIEGVQALRHLVPQYEDQIGIFIKIDVGYGRTGIPATDYDRLDVVLEQIKESNLPFRGFLTHSGHTYHCQSPEEVKAIYDETTPLMTSLKERYLNQFPSLILSMGDTPTCSIVDDMSAYDEIRPGNFVFYDLEQASIGACSWDDIAVAVACPIVAKHPQRREIIVYGGGVHCSKDRLTSSSTTSSNDNNNPTTIFGRVANQVGKEGSSLEWGSVVDDMYVRSLSQEHGIIVVPEKEDFDKQKIGDVIFLLPVHSCMTADCLKHQGYVTTDGEKIERMKN